MLSRKEFIRKLALGSAVAPLVLQQFGCSSGADQSTSRSNASADSTRVAGAPGPPPPGGPGGPPPGWKGGPPPGGPGGPPPPPHHASKPGPTGQAEDGTSCYSTPELTGGPYPYDLSGKGAMTRRIIHENRPGLPLEFTFTLVNTKQGCAAIPDARIDVWH